MTQNLPEIILHGWVNLYKPKGVSSAKSLNILKKFLHRKHKIGHAGTLDPLAEGVLPVAIGEATKTIPYVQADDKEYIFQITWGESRSTGDAEGEIISTSSVRPSLTQIINILPKFIGTLRQTPPASSALKIEGKRAYELARQGVDFILPFRTVQIHFLEILENIPFGTRVVDLATRDEQPECTLVHENCEIPQVSQNHNLKDERYIPEKTTTFKVSCSKGTYIRSLAIDMAKELATEGYVSSLIRTRVGGFLQKDALETEKLVASGGKDLLCRSLRTIVDVLDDTLAINIEEQDEQHLRQGRIIQANVSEKFDSPVALCIRAKDKQPVAIVKISEEGLKPIRVFNINT